MTAKISLGHDHLHSEKHLRLAIFVDLVPQLIDLEVVATNCFVAPPIDVRLHLDGFHRQSEGCILGVIVRSRLPIRRLLVVNCRHYIVLKLEKCPIPFRSVFHTMRDVKRLGFFSNALYAALTEG